MFSWFATRTSRIAFACFRRRLFTDWNNVCYNSRIILNARVTGLAVTGILIPPRLEKHVASLSPKDRFDLVMTFNQLPHETERDDQLLREFSRGLSKGEAVLLRVASTHTLILGLPYCNDDKDEPLFNRIADSFISYVKAEVLNKKEYKDTRLVLVVSNLKFAILRIERGYPILQSTVHRILDEELD
ncbi:hypothetical protein MMC10_008527 [Thelotrema lepadinum]|nr:hypothetical protein [Thelotrema lepadinum]